MKYKVESIRSEFSNKAIGTLEKLLEQRASQGYKFNG